MPNYENLLRQILNHFFSKSGACDFIKQYMREIWIYWDRSPLYSFVCIKRAVKISALVYGIWPFIVGSFKNGLSLKKLSSSLLRLLELHQYLDCSTTLHNNVPQFRTICVNNNYESRISWMCFRVMKRKLLSWDWFYSHWNSIMKILVYFFFRWIPMRENVDI